MFGISSFEALVIIFVAVVIFKPKDLVGIITNISLFIAKIKDFFASINQEVEKIGVLSKLEDFVLVEKNKEDMKNSENLDNKIEDINNDKKI
jgi:Sec-independent protein translocase protein TatA